MIIIRTTYGDEERAKRSQCSHDEKRSRRHGCERLDKSLKLIISIFYPTLAKLKTISLILQRFDKKQTELKIV